MTESRQHILRFNASNKNSTDSFKTLLEGTKVVETRAATDKYRKVKTGDMLVFVCGKKKLEKKVKKAKVFKFIDSMAKVIPFKKVNPWAKNIKELKEGYS